MNREKKAKKRAILRSWRFCRAGGEFAARRRSRLAWHELAVGGGLPLCIGVGLLRIEVVAAFLGAVGRFGVPCSGTRLRPVHGEELVEVSGVQSMGSANSRPGVRSVGWRLTSLWMLGWGGRFTWRLSYPRSSGEVVDGRVGWTRPRRLALSAGLVYGAGSAFLG